MNVRLDDDVELLDRALLELLVEVVQRDLAHVLGALHPLELLPLGADLAGALLVLGDVERVARVRQPVEAEDLHRRRGRRLLEAVALVVEQGPDAAGEDARHEGVADAHHAALDEDRRHDAAAQVDARLHDPARSAHAVVGPELEELGLEQDGLEQLVDARLLEGGHLHEQGLAAPVLGHQLVLGQLLLDALDVGVGQVDLVDRHDDRHAGRLGVADRLEGLRHDPVVRGHHQHDDVRDLGAAHPHRRERLVAGRVEEHDPPLREVDGVGADVLRDAAVLGGHDVRLADRVQQLGLAVVDVAHDRHDGRTWLEVAVLVRLLLDHGLFVEGDDVDLGPVLLGEKRRRLGVDLLVDGDHHAHAHQLRDQLRALEVQLAGKLRNRDRFEDGDLLGDGVGALRGALLHLERLLLMLFLLPPLRVVRLLPLGLELAVRARSLRRRRRPARLAGTRAAGARPHRPRPERAPAGGPGAHRPLAERRPRAGRTVAETAAHRGPRGAHALAFAHRRPGHRALPHARRDGADHGARRRLRRPLLRPGPVACRGRRGCCSRPRGRCGSRPHGRLRRGRSRDRRGPRRFGGPLAGRRRGRRCVGKGRGRLGRDRGRGSDGLGRRGDDLLHHDPFLDQDLLPGVRQGFGLGSGDRRRRGSLCGGGRLLRLDERRFLLCWFLVRHAFGPCGPAYPSDSVPAPSICSPTHSREPSASPTSHPKTPALLPRQLPRSLRSGRGWRARSRASSP